MFPESGHTWRTDCAARSAAAAAVDDGGWDVADDGDDDGDGRDDCRSLSTVGCGE